MVENLLAGFCGDGCLTGSPHLVQHLHAVLLEAGVVVWFPWSPVGERHPVSVRPGEKTLHAQVVHTGPDVDVGCGDPENVSLVSSRQNPRLSSPSVQQFTYKTIPKLIFQAFVSFTNSQCVLVLTGKQVALHPALLRQGADGQQVGSHRPADLPRLVPRLLVSKG